MGRNDQQAIEDLFDKLADAEKQSGPRDREAEAFIRSAIGRQPNAPYYMAQTIIVQQQALNEARRRPGEDSPRRNERVDDRRNAGGPWGGGGFLAGAAQTAMGVAGGVLLGNLIGGALFGHPAAAQESDGNDRDNDNNDNNNNDDVADAGDAGDFDGGGFDA
ncbi:DUF2076 domain-containing protein [soil metagenome]